MHADPRAVVGKGTDYPCGDQDEKNTRDWGEIEEMEVGRIEDALGESEGWESDQLDEKPYGMIRGMEDAMIHERENVKGEWLNGIGGEVGMLRVEGGDEAEVRISPRLQT